VTEANKKRAAHLKELANSWFDILVVGGGITGAGIARDAATRGLKVALVEKLDFGSGTSSRSSKLIHGGLRYLEQAEFALVFESVNERKRLMNLAPHLVRPLPFLVTNYAGDRRWLPTLAVGLWIYDGLCLFQNYKNHTTYGRQKTLELEPHLKQQGLRGGILYYDCQTDDARLTLENVVDAELLGASIGNHLEATSLLRTSKGRICGVEALDLETQQRLEIKAKMVINASGPWCDEVLKLKGELGILGPTKGVHVVVDEARLPVKHALMLNSPRDKRVLFCIPFGLGRTVVGTTDTFTNQRADDVAADADDVEYLLETANAYFPSAQLTQDDVLSTWAGLRPLIKGEEGAGASAVSREHLLLESPGFLTIAGGKLTTFRLMAEEVVDRALLQLKRTIESQTHARKFPGSFEISPGQSPSEPLYQRQLLAMANQLKTRHALTEDDPTFVAETYGARAPLVIGQGHKARRISAELPHLFEQVSFAVEHEYARSLDDVLSRRVPLVLRAREQGLDVASAIAQQMAPLLDWTPAQTLQEIEDYSRVVRLTRQFRT
jgi:glycerol-3-phosphate dehydrogenase